jgi:aminoglycoside phosphotransferase (APT) family kinase protein
MVDGPAAIGSGVLSPAALVEGRVRMRHWRGRHGDTLTVEDLAGPSYFVKRRDDARDDTGALRREREVLARLAGRPSLASHVPVVAPEVSDDRQLVLHLLSGAVNLAEHHATSRGLAVPLAAEAGRLLAVVHATPWAEGDREASAPPAVLAVAVPDYDLFCSFSGANLECVHVLQQTPGLAEALAELSAAWAPTHLVHGDVRLANLMAEDADGAAPPLWLVDWESAALGDPWWDVAGLLAGWLSVWLGSIPDLDGLGPSDLAAAAARPLESLRPGMQAAWRAYAACRGLDAAASRTGLLAAIRFTGAVLVETAFSIGQDAPALSGHQLRHLQVAHNVMSRPVEAGVQLMGFGFDELVDP